VRTSVFTLLLFIQTVSHAASPVDFGVRVNGGRLQFENQVEDTADFEKYVEAEAYVQYFLSNMFALRLGGFGRFSDDRNYGGFQFSSPLVLDVKRLGLATYMAPGYRYMNRGLSAPTLESGLNLNFIGDVGLGYRLILNEWVKNGLKTEGQVFVSFGF